MEITWKFFDNQQMPPCPELVHYPQKRQRSYSFLAAINDENVPIREISNETVEHRPVVISEVLDNLKMPRESPR